ncbi:hypothetical protein EB796_000918 [Bugula neritina]|uniref:Uncharacterized protein n=1 Tax=Bugula neritina TaxID=10212 RepID=A0A7J7KRE9_BUGNE|nr:hypothetical protein EB796_000918 [Bugula neritina]
MLRSTQQISMRIYLQAHLTCQQWFAGLSPPYACTPYPAPRSLPFRQMESGQPMQNALPGILENVPHRLNPIAMQSQCLSPSASSTAPQLPPVAPLGSARLSFYSDR